MNGTSREGSSGDHDVASVVDDWEGDTESEGDTGGSGPASPDTQAAIARPETRTRVTIAREDRRGQPWNLTHGVEPPERQSVTALGQSR